MAENNEKSAAQPAHNNTMGDELLVKHFKAGDASAFDNKRVEDGIRTRDPQIHNLVL